MKSKKLCIIALFIVGMMTIVTGCGSGSQTSGTSDSSKKEVTVKIGADSSAFSTLFYVARDKGYFEKHGIEAQINPYSYGIDTIDAVLTNQVDVGLAMDFAALSRLSSGDLKIFAFNQQVDSSKEKVVARDGINSPGELKGQSIAVKRGTVDEYAMVRYLEKYNIKIDEVKKQGFSSDAEILSAFQKGDVKATFFSGNLLDKALQVQGAKVIGSKADIPFASRGFLLANSKFLGQKDVAKNILLALNDATKYINENPAGAAEVMTKALKIPQDSLEKDIKSRSNDIRLNDDDVKQLQEVYEYASDSKLIKGGFNLKDKIDTNPLKAALPGKLTYKPE
ncbi:ABC transporter substrate-binding protein [Clostridium luticellarii]|nr:ABC transporter substrate-binding protein [Clostridium luticellarii]MCI1945370.1 ABC transporter substrate-binding protein [Clostridium luticellarii]MCI1968665.1 ABC transporter substrate-binding protein [Clostridium luticellarii]MCI1996992.1 ABC transporter substrate-binding protein [Clostridium luticellarii]MCI2040419.1 ABC transporter substrate-binding protein [Clostridium luticellarii]